MQEGSRNGEESLNGCNVNPPFLNLQFVGVFMKELILE